MIGLTMRALCASRSIPQARIAAVSRQCGHRNIRNPLTTWTTEAQLLVVCYFDKVRRESKQVQTRFAISPLRPIQSCRAIRGY